MAPKKAVVVTRGDVTVGYLGEGPGPFVTLVHSGLPHPWLDVVRFNCRTRTDEGPVSDVLTAAKTFDDALKGLQALGYKVTAVAYDAHFAAPEASPRIDPASDDAGPR